MLIIWILFKEYNFYKEQTSKLIELQSDYRNYLMALRRAFDEQKDIETEAIIEEKKKPFLIINRSKTYLKQSFLDFLKKKKLQSSKTFNKLYEVSDKNFDSKRLKKDKKKNIENFNIIKGLPSKNYDSVKGFFIWPLKHKEFWISSFFGLRKIKRGYSFHYGIDMAAVKGTTIRAAASGKVKEASYSSGYGNTVLIMHDSRYQTRYAHLNKIYVKVGQNIEQGHNIGTVGDTGSVRSSGKSRDASHLHFEVYDFNKKINPLYVLQ